MSEIKLRAAQRIGQLSRELEKVERSRTDLHPTHGKQTKTEQLTARRNLDQRSPPLRGTGGSFAEAIPVISAATDNYPARTGTPKDNSDPASAGP
jgi:hypothetical protein